MQMDSLAAIGQYRNVVSGRCRRNCEDRRAHQRLGGGRSISDALQLRNTAAQLHAVVDACTRAHNRASFCFFAVEQSRNEETHMTKERLSSKVAITTLLPLLLGVLAGCGGGGSSTSTSNNGGGSNGGASTLPAGTELLYVGDNAGVIHGFAVDPNSGTLTALAVTNQAAAGTVRLAGDLGGKVLYATDAVTGGPNVASFLVDQT